MISRALAAIALSSLLLAASGATTRAASVISPETLDAACLTANPYLVTVCYPEERRPPADLAALPAVVMLRDSPRNDDQWALADMSQVGAVYGLAYASSTRTVYAAAFHKRGVLFGPGGPGAIYGIDLRNGHVSVFASVPDAGADRHAAGLARQDLAAAEWATKTSLGDIDLDADETQLFVVNLADRRIHRFRLADGTHLDSFAHGAAHEAWAADARPFGLRFHEGRLYHGVVHSAQVSRRTSDLSAYVFSSRPDGTDMRMVASTTLDYPRGTAETVRWICSGPGDCPSLKYSLAWRPWRDDLINPHDEAGVLVYPMPIAADIEFDAAGALVIGLRDRVTDAAVAVGEYAYRAVRQEMVGLGIGDVLRGVPDGDVWRVGLVPEHYDDTITCADESLLGALARIAVDNMMAATRLADRQPYPWEPVPRRGVTWYYAATGQKSVYESVCDVGVPLRRPWTGNATNVNGPALPSSPQHNEGVHPGTLGDLEALCPAADRPTATETTTPSATTTPPATVTGTATRRPSATPTPRTPTVTPSATATATPTAIPGPCYLPLLLRERCTPKQMRVDVVLVLDASTSMLDEQAGRTKLAGAQEAARIFLDNLRLTAGDQAGIVAFNSDAELLQPLSGSRADLIAALDRIEVRQQTRIDRGVEEATRELASARRAPANAPVMIVLTDGYANPVGPEVAEERAATAKAAGVTVFTIGLGTDVDRASLARMASGSDRFYYAPSAAELADIYRRIAVTLPCPPGSFWGQKGRARTM